MWPWRGADQMSIRLRIFLVCAAPCLALTILSLAVISGALERKSTADAISAAVADAPVVNALVHELQRERGLSAGFIGSRGARFGDDLIAQRAATDTALARYKVIEASGAQREPVLSASVGETLSGLNEMRAAVQRFEPSVGQMAGYYTPLIGDLLRLSTTATIGLDDGAVSDAGAAYAAVLQAKERAGLERAMGADSASANVQSLARVIDEAGQGAAHSERAARTVETTTAELQAAVDAFAQAVAAA